MMLELPYALILVMLAGSASAGPDVPAPIPAAAPTTVADSSCEVAPGITLRGCGFSEDVRVSTGIIMHGSHAIRVDLASGQRPRLDGRTPSGRYRLADGSSVEVFSPTGYPRNLNWRTRPVRAIEFVLPEDGEYGLLVEAAGSGRPLDRELLERFAARFDVNQPSRRSDRRAGDALAIGLPRSGHSRAVVEIPADLGPDVSVSWLEFAAPLIPDHANASQSHTRDHIAATIAGASIRANVVIHASTPIEIRPRTEP